MNKRQRMKFASIDASGVKEIADMQRYIDRLEDYLWRMFMFIKGWDDGRSMIQFTEKDSPTRWAVEEIYDFIKKHKEASNGK